MEEIRKIKEGRLICRIFAMNGKSISMGCSESHYCGPRKNFQDFDGDWEFVELGFPEGFRNLKGIDGDGDVYGWVSIDIVVSFIKSNGGLRAIKCSDNNHHLIPEKILNCWDYEGLMKKPEIFSGFEGFDINFEMEE